MAGNGRDPGNDLVVVGLATGKTHAGVAEVAGVSERTVRRRGQDPEVAEAVERLRSALVEQASGRLLDAVHAAIDTMTDVLAAESDAVRLRAAIAVLDKALQLRQLDLLERRVASLESAHQALSSEDGSWWAAG